MPIGVSPEEFANADEWVRKYVRGNVAQYMSECQSTEPVNLLKDIKQ